MAQARLISIPSVQRQHAAGRSFHLTSASRLIVAAHTDAAVRSAADLLASDLAAITGGQPLVAHGAPRMGDIVLRQNPRDAALGPEEYKLDIGEHVTISASTPAGIFYGAQTLLQFLKQSRNLPGMAINDRPAYPIRAVMVDVGRKYFSVPWLMSTIREMAYLKLNTLHLHLTDNQGFRIQSRTHPELNKGTSPVYSYNDIRRLVDWAQRCHVTVVPELDLPAHASTILAAHPEMRLVSSSGKVAADKLDLSKPAAYRLVDDLIGEYLPLFPGPYWHAGADEYLHPGEFNDYPQMADYARAHWGTAANGVDTYLNYVNSVDTLVRAHGKRTWAWSDPHEYLPYAGVATLNKDITLEAWNGYSDPKQLIEQGYRLVNATYQPLYYNVGIPFTDASKLYQEWAPNGTFSIGSYSGVAPDAPHLQGAEFCIWCDSAAAETEAGVALHIATPLRAFAQNCWGAPKLVKDFAQFTGVVKRIGAAPAHSRSQEAGRRKAWY